MLEPRHGQPMEERHQAHWATFGSTSHVVARGTCPGRALHTSRRAAPPAFGSWRGWSGLRAVTSRSHSGPAISSRSRGAAPNRRFGLARAPHARPWGPLRGASRPWRATFRRRVGRERAASEAGHGLAEDDPARPNTRRGARRLGATAGFRFGARAPAGGAAEPGRPAHAPGLRGRAGYRRQALPSPPGRRRPPRRRSRRAGGQWSAA
jgi:hypothetical protein